MAKDTGRQSLAGRRAEENSVTPGLVRLHILCFEPQRSAALLFLIEIKRDTDHSRQWLAMDVSGDARKLDHRRHLANGGAATRSLSAQGNNQRQQSNYDASDAELHGGFSLGNSRTSVPNRTECRE